MSTAIDTTAPAPGVSPRAHRGSRLRDDRRHALIFLAPSLIGLALFTLFPTVMALVMSLFDWPVFGERTFRGFDNYARLLGNPVFRQVVLNTCLFVVLYIPLNLSVSLGLAVWVSPRIKGRPFFRILFFIPVMTPVVANAVVWRFMYQPGGLLDSVSQSVLGSPAPSFLASSATAMLAIVVMSVWQGFGYNFLVFSTAIDQVPKEQLEAAAIDGASGRQRFWHVTLPMITPAIFFATTLTLITSFQVFAQPFLLTKGGPGNSTATLVLFVYNEGWRFLHMGLAAAAGWVLFVIIMGITAVQFLGQKRWVHYD
jgi:multiple sugar transport system permease protein